MDKTRRIFAFPLAQLAIFGGLFMALCQYLVFFYAPLESSMGVVQKIFYFHLPVAWWCFGSFFVSALASGLYLKTKNPFWDTISHASVEVGMVLATLALITGSIWARYSWNTWWTWDPRLTTTLILWFIYAGFLALRGMDMRPGRKATVCAVISLVGFLDVPLVFLSARLWRSIHPAVFASKGGGLEPEMAFTAIACVLCFGLLWFALTLYRSRQLLLEAAFAETMQQEDKTPE